MYYIDIFLIFIYVYVFHLLFLYRCTVALSRTGLQVLSLPAPLSSQAPKRLLMTTVWKPLNLEHSSVSFRYRNYLCMAQMCSQAIC